MSATTLTRKDEGKADHGRFLQGPALCLHCGHKWTGCALTGTTLLLCPACSLMKGTFYFRVTFPAFRFVCGCGNDTFQIDANGTLCGLCGHFTDFDTLLGEL